MTQNLEMDFGIANEQPDRAAILDGLNDPQREAVKTVDGPLLILAGAGSGKTRVLTRRIAYLVEEIGVPPWQILAMTFTNKAAGEMRERVESLIDRSTRGMWIGTFHAICARILRMESEAAGLGTNFSIYDSADQLALLRQIIRDHGKSDKDFPPKQVRARISSAKNKMLSPDDFMKRAHSYYDQEVSDFYRSYQESLLRNNAVDFDDLLMRTVRVMADHPVVLEKYQERFQYVMIDEYQDTNRPQYLLAGHLAAKHRNLCVVGDDDQSIYGWRGADIKNILDFEKDYADATVIRLEQNYRSTQVILDAGNAVIGNNRGRKGKRLWTERAGGEKIKVRRALDEVDEARWLVTSIQELNGLEKFKLRDTAILYRTNAQSRSLEEQLVRANVPYTIVGDVKFYERKEIKDVLAYLRVVDNPQDGISLARVVNTPKRGIGDTSYNRLVDHAARTGMAPYDALGCAEDVEGLSKAAANKMLAFREMIEGFRAQRETTPADALAGEIIRETRYLESLGDAGQIEAETRRENVQELLANIRGFVERAEEPTLEAFLREVALVADVDGWDDSNDAVTLMTLHSAKGLEFRAVFIAGLEEGLFPIVRGGGDVPESESEVEEERRLFYVGITRARERLFLTHARNRMRFGGSASGTPSRFLAEIPGKLLDEGLAGRERDFTAPSRARHIPAERSEPKSTSAPSVFHDEPAAESRSPEPHKGGDGPLLIEEGAWVVHPFWGRGLIEAKSGSGENAKLTIRFQGTTKKIIQKYARLMPG